MESTVKPYEFKRLEGKDVFVMIRLIKKVGVDSFKELLSTDSISKAITMALTEYKEESNDETKEESKDEAKVKALYTQVGLAVFDLVALLIDRLEVCENEIYLLLSSCSNLSTNEIKELDIAIFMEMIVDFIKKEELVDFCKVALKLFK